MNKKPMTAAMIAFRALRKHKAFKSRLRENPTDKYLELEAAYWAGVLHCARYFKDGMGLADLG